MSCAAQPDGETAGMAHRENASTSDTVLNPPLFSFFYHRDEGAKAIAQMIQDPGNKLTTIKLSDNSVGAAGAAALAKATTRWGGNVLLADLIVLTC